MRFGRRGVKPPGANKARRLRRQDRFSESGSQYREGNGPPTRADGIRGAGVTNRAYPGR